MPKLHATVVALSLLSAPHAPGQTRPAPGSDAAFERRVEEMLGRMTLEEKVELLGGVDDFYVRHWSQRALRSNVS